MRDSEPLAIRRARSLRKQMTDAEVILWSRLRRDVADGFHFRKQHPVGPYIADFACPKAKLIVEVDGDTHWTTIGMAHDRRRDQFLFEHGWQVLRVSNADVRKRLDVVMEGIARHLPGGTAPLRPLRGHFPP